MHLALKHAGAVLVLSLVATTATANATFRCGGRLIRPGITQAEVLKRCGPPTSKSEETVPVRSGDLGGGSRVVGETTKSRWTYQSSARTRVLLFDQDILRAIQ